MESWINLSTLLVVLVVVLLALWLVTLFRARRVVFDRTAAERMRIDLQLSLAEQTGRLGIIR